LSRDCKNGGIFSLAKTFYMLQQLKNLRERFDAPGPKRILALDGGGIRGILTLGMLKKIEDLAKEKTGNPNLVLGDYYDLIGGTSTGAIIACGLAIGKTVDELIALYLGLGKEIFGKGLQNKLLKRSWTNMRAIFAENYSSSNLEKYLYNTFKEINIGDTQNIKCGLAINSKRADTYSLWTVANHPAGIYFNANAHIKLWELCRASSAAPYYFKPKKLGLRRRNGEPIEATFIDGGVSLANNPAWQTFLVATVPSFGFNWKHGKDEIFITSLGTGNGQKKEDPDLLAKSKSISWASKLSDLFMVDALEMNQIIMDAFGHNAGPAYSVDSQFGDVSMLKLIKNDTDKLFSFARHNVSLTVKDLPQLGFPADEEKINSLKQMDYYENMEMLLNIGNTYGAKNIDVKSIF
jgi:uncharacterized protein